MFGRDRMPGPQVGIIDTFLGVLLIAQNLVRNIVTVPSVFLTGFRDGLFRPFHKKRYDFLIIHALTPLYQILSPYYTGFPCYLLHLFSKFNKKQSYFRKKGVAFNATPFISPTVSVQACQISLF